MSELAEQTLEIIIDFFNAVEAAVISAKQQVAKIQKVEAGDTWNPDKIPWQHAEGTKGPYERYPASGQKAEATDDYKNMLADIKQHNGKMTRRRYFYWVFSDASTVGRKKRSK